MRTSNTLCFVLKVTEFCFGCEFKKANLRSAQTFLQLSLRTFLTAKVFWLHKENF